MSSPAVWSTGNGPVLLAKSRSKGLVRKPARMQTSCCRVLASNKGNTQLGCFPNHLAPCENIHRVVCHSIAAQTRHSPGSDGMLGKPAGKN